MSINKKLLLLIIIAPGTLFVLWIVGPIVALAFGMIPLCKGIYEMVTTKEN